MPTRRGGAAARARRGARATRTGASRRRRVPSVGRLQRCARQPARVRRRLRVARRSRDGRIAPWLWKRRRVTREVAAARRRSAPQPAPRRRRVCRPRRRPTRPRPADVELALLAAGKIIAAEREALAGTAATAAAVHGGAIGALAGPRTGVTIAIAAADGGDAVCAPSVAPTTAPRRPARRSQRRSSLQRLWRRRRRIILGPLRESRPLIVGASTAGHHA